MNPALKIWRVLFPVSPRSVAREAAAWLSCVIDWDNFPKELRLAVEYGQFDLAEIMSTESVKIREGISDDELQSFYERLAIRIEEGLRDSLLWDESFTVRTDFSTHGPLLEAMGAIGIPADEAKGLFPSALVLTIYPRDFRISLGGWQLKRVA